MRLRGDIDIELTDVVTGDVETHHETNMMTNAVNEILNSNPFAVFYNAMDGNSGVEWFEDMLPMCPHMIGGILLFPETLEEDAENTYQYSDNMPVAYASNDVNATANVARGSMNLTESMPIENGYKFVWEFTAGQGNGTISALGLTSANGGKNAYGSIVDDSSTFKNMKTGRFGYDVTKAYFYDLLGIVEVDFEHDTAWSFHFESSAVVIKKPANTVILQPRDVLHIPGLGFDGLVGYSPIAMAKNAIGLAIAAEEYGSKFYANGAAPSGVLEHPGTLKDPSKVRDAWMSQFGGSANSGKVAVLEEGMKYTPISISPEQAQFLETRKFQIDEIARIFRVPPHMVGDLEKSSFSNIEQQSLEFVKYTLDPWVMRWEQSIQRSLFNEDEKKTYFVKFNVEGLLRGDYQSRMQGYATARQNGWMSANDIRELENLDRIPKEDGGDLYLVNGNMVPLTLAGAAYVDIDDGGKEEKADEKILEVDEPGSERKRSRRESPVPERNNC